MPPVLNIPGLKIWKGCEYARVTYSGEYDLRLKAFDDFKNKQKIV